MAEKSLIRRKKRLILLCLIGIGILAILVSLYIQYGKPYLLERSREKLDQVRIKDLDNLNKSVANVIIASSTAPIGANNTIYISLPSNDPACANLDLPSVPDGWTYHCTPNLLLNVNGTGWIPANVSASMKMLPVDPVNNPDTLDYYSYVASSTASTSPQYVITSVLDSKKYLKQKAQTDGGTDDIRYEVGNYLALSSYINGLIGFWPMNEGNGNVFKDQSMRNTNLTIVGPVNWKGELFYFDGKNNYVFVNDTIQTSNLGSHDSSYTLSLWIKPTSIKDESVTEKWLSNEYPWAIRIEDGQIIFGLYDGENWAGSYTSPPFKLSDKNWINVVAIKDQKNNETSLFINGYLISVNPINTINDNLDLSNNLGFTIGSRDLKKDYHIMVI